MSSRDRIIETSTRFGIVNAEGGIWSANTFRSEEAAWSYLRASWSGNVAGFTVERVHVRIERIAPAPRPVAFNQEAA